MNHDTSDTSLLLLLGEASLMARSSTFRTRSRCRNVSYMAFCGESGELNQKIAQISRKQLLRLRYFDFRIL